MISIYPAAEARAAADTFYGPLQQIFDYIRSRSKEGMYVVNVSGVELNSKQIAVLQGAGYNVEQTVDGQDKIVYVIKWGDDHA